MSVPPRTRAPPRPRTLTYSAISALGAVERSVRYETCDGTHTARMMALSWGDANRIDWDILRAVRYIRFTRAQVCLKPQSHCH